MKKLEKSYLEQEHIEMWTQKRFTGYAAKWYFEDESGNIVDIGDSYLEELDPTFFIML